MDHHYLIGKTSGNRKQISSIDVVISGRPLTFLTDFWLLADEVDLKLLFQLLPNESPELRRDRDFSEADFNFCCSTLRLFCCDFKISTARFRARAVSKSDSIRIGSAEIRKIQNTGIPRYSRGYVPEKVWPANTKTHILG